jgi:predicted nucleic acid-binding Zn ribbon protein
MWEELQKFSDPVITLCKSCEKEGGVRKLLPGQMNFILKGSGWYKDGYSPKPQNRSDEEKT